MNPERSTDTELYVQLVPGYHVGVHRQAFPARIDAQRDSVWVRPRFHRDVAEALAEWLNTMHPADPDWYHLARFDGDTLIITTGDGPHQTSVIHPDADGRYLLGGWCWFLSTPTLTPEALHRETKLLRDPARRIPVDGEVMVSCDSGQSGKGVFPARVDPTLVGGDPVPTFRPEIAEAVVAWCNTRHRTDPDRYPQAYFDGTTLVHIHQHLRALDAYVPWRIDPDQHGHYRIDGDEWTWRHVSTSTAVSSATATKI